MKMSDKFHFADTSEKFDDWFDDLDNTQQNEVLRDLYKYIGGNTGKAKKIPSSKLFELKLHSGLRVYFSLLSVNQDIVLIWGGDKDSQSRDIELAIGYLEKYISEEYHNGISRLGTEQIVRPR